MKCLMHLSYLLLLFFLGFFFNGVWLETLERGVLFRGRGVIIRLLRKRSQLLLLTFWARRGVGLGVVGRGRL